jgi:CRISPR-associated protein Csb1
VEGTGGATEGYGFVPFHRTEYVARDIVASFCVDLDQLASYGLPPEAADLLAALARWEVRSLLDHGFRPRTACDLAVEDPEAVDAILPSLEELNSTVRRLAPVCAQLIGDGEPLEVVWDKRKAKG